MKGRWLIYIQATRPMFLSASVVPVLVGTAAGLAATGSVDWTLFLAALIGIMVIHAGSNVINDYFDHRSGNDWVNPNPTPFSGGRQFIQKGIMSPQATLRLGLGLLGAGCVVGLFILAVTRSILILGLGLAGVLGGYFYTARPVQIGYRGLGELVIGLLFGLFPVYGAYYLQTNALDLGPGGPAFILSCLIFMVILINEFPDLEADRKVAKGTLVVLLGVPAGIWIYRIVLLCTYVTALIMGLGSWSGRLYILTLPIGAGAWIRAAQYRYNGPSAGLEANRLTILLHLVGGLLITGGLVIDRYI